MKITFVLASMNLAGGTRVVLMIAEHLRRRGHDVVIVYPPHPPRTMRGRIKSFLKREVSFRNPEFDYLRQLNLGVEVRALESHRPVGDADVPDADAVVATYWETANWVAGLSPSKGTKVYFIQQYEANFGHPAELVDATWALPFRKVVCSRWLADLARNRFHDEAAIVVENGIDPSLFHAPPRGKQPRPTVGFLYAPTIPVKATPASLRVIRRVKDCIPDVVVRSFGRDTVDPESPLPDFVSYTRWPHQTELRDIYASCDVWLCTSTSEGFHLPPHEAMACRCPVVSTRVGGPVELVRDGVNGYLTDIGDEDALVDRLTDVLRADPDRWRSLSDAALETALRYSWDHTAQAFERAIRES